ncbi:hypothetical protein DFH07DRAFT_815091 [Mycena maculata]|uniref:F-box domain-containing protein n=1 Tax=Mycena maculata TaxID=230809 RepID=A0AAD7JF10_9AGAR|nr:hypothetical protein DFH07DRAFT_815091 [Mycena maculata]
MSAEDVRVAIDKISVDIERRKEVLRTLEAKKILLHRQLNAFLDPVARMPLEISSEIFIQCLPPFPEPGSSHIPMLFLNVCKAWTEIALSTPALWSAIHVQFPRPKGFGNALENWFQRARSRPLSISFRGDFDDDVATAVRQRAMQLENLDIYDADDRSGIVDLLGGLGPGSFPLLKTLTIGASEINKDGDDVCFDPESILDIFLLAPVLVECTLDSLICHSPSLYDRIAREQLVLPSLRRLRFGRSLKDIYTHDGILRYLTLPSLRTLFLSMKISSDDLISFLKRSSPPLRHLVISEAGVSNFLQLDPYLRLLPTVTHFELCGPSGLVQELFAALVESPSSLLPHLQSLRIILSDWETPQSLWEVLHRALSVRRTHLTHFTMEALQGPNSELRAVFRQLVAEGMDLSIGNDFYSYVP